MTERRLLVTGGAGFIGANFVHHWLAAHPQDRLVVLDRLSYAGGRENLAALADHPGLRFVRGDICDQALVESLLAEERLDTVVHLAAESHVDRSIHHPQDFVTVNVLGTQCLLDAARAVWLAGDGPQRFPRHRFHLVSTDEVYGDLPPAAPPSDENARYAPSSPYAASKAAADHLVRAWHRTYGIEVSVSNCSNNYGPWQFPEKLIPLVITNALGGLPLPVYGDGRQVRDWLHVADHCRGIECVLEHGRPGETYHLGARCERTNLEVVQAVCALLDDLVPEAPCRPHRSLLRFVSDRPGHDRRYALDPGRAERELGFAAAISFEAGLEQTVRWYLDHAEWWRARRDDPAFHGWVQRQYGAAPDAALPAAR